MTDSHRFRTGRLRAAMVATAIAALGIFGLAACTAAPDQGPEPTASSSSRTRALPTGTVGAAHLDNGYLEVGTGPKTVDVYLDPMCPICGVFEKANGKQLSDLVDAGTITLRLHPMTFLNRVSQGTDYSTRAAAALTCVGATDASKTLPYLEFLYGNQPKENSAGLTDKTLIEMATAIGAPDISQCVNDQTYAGWVQKANDNALSGPIEGADIPAITGTPTVLVDGKSYVGSVDDPDELAAFIAS